MLMPLTVVVNFGSMLRFDKDDSTQSKKLNEMDLDDILSCAEAYKHPDR